MTSPPTSTEDYLVQQEHELEALSSIFGDDFKDLRSNDTWKVQRPPEVYLCLRPNGLNNGQESYVAVDMQVKCPATYPDAPPVLELKNAKGLSNENLQCLLDELLKLVAVRRGEGFLSEYNKPPPSSFHEEMLKNQRRQQEKLDLEEKRRRDQRRKQEEDTEREIMAEIQRREEDKREEKRRKEMAKLLHRTSPEPPEPKKVVVGPRRRTTSNTPPQLLHFSNSSVGELLVHRGKCLGESERLGRSVYYGFEAHSGDFVVVYEWALQWSKKMGKFFTSQEKSKIENCKKQASPKEHFFIVGAESELNSLLKLEHPHLVHYQALSSSLTDERLVVQLLVEHVAGSNLGQALQRQAAVPLDRLREHAGQLLAALDYLHANSVVHKQLGPSSVLLDAQGLVRLTDYSLAKRLGDICREDVFEQPSHVRFCEQASGKKGDVWSLGLTLLELSQGREVREYPVVLPTDLPDDFQDFLKRFAGPLLPILHEFEELQLLGKGAFGAVIKVQNKLDGCYYAVKRILVNPASKQFRRIKGEVTLLSRLNHENIVRYYNAWIERNETPPATGLSLTDSSDSRGAAGKVAVAAPRGPSLGFNALSLNTLGLPKDAVEQNAPPPALASSDEPSKRQVVDTTESTDSERTSLVAHYLYIQMEYCEKSTLRDTIDQGLYQDNSRLWRLFREILDGLAYIPRPGVGMIHRDLKPVNIFLDSQDHVKIGDFGLATDHRANVAAGKLELEESGPAAMPKPDPTGNMTGMVGTALYKVDLFSLGIILFEMSYRPMTTGSERISVISQLRSEDIDFPEDFSQYEKGTQELLRSELLPPPLMEESELHEVLQHTMANVNGKAYRTMVGQLFAQNTTPVMDYAYDMDHHKLYDGTELPCFMDHSGMLVTLPYDLRMAFARYVARCAFDIVSPATASLMPDAEVIYTVSEVIQEFPALQERNYHIYLNHTNLLKAILLHSGVPEDKLSHASSILCDAMSEKLTRREVEAKFCNLSLSTNSVQTLYKYIEAKGDLDSLEPLLASLTKQKKTAVAQLAKQAHKDLEEVTALLRRLGVKLQVVVNLGLVYKVQHHSGVIFQFVAFVRKRKRTVPDIVLEFRGPASTAPVPSAVGVSVALDKVCAAMASMEEP
ncbi:hypothetical protein CRUP_026599, partial [Coryphaenoides rupestris]